MVVKLSFENRNLSIWVSGVLLVLISFVAFATYNAQIATANSLVLFLVRNHMIIMILMVVFSVLFGYFWSQNLYNKIDKEQATSKSIMDVVIHFLSNDEQKIVQHIVELDGKTTQAEIARINNIGKVRAFRAVQKMQEKGIIEVVPHGKVRRVLLKEDIVEILKR